MMDQPEDDLDGDSEDGLDGDSEDGLGGDSTAELADDIEPAEPVDRLKPWRGLPTPLERVSWFEQLWIDVCGLRVRYRLAVRTRWWADDLQLEALAALAAWVQRYDSGDWDDPPGKLTLLFELERLEGLLRDGNDPFHPQRDRADFDRHLERIRDS